MKIYALQTGTVRIKEAQRIGHGRGPLRLAHVFLDHHWTEPLPIYAWLIEHPDGLIVVDTGERAAASQPGYFPVWHPYYRSVAFDITPEEEIGPQLRRMGVDPQKDVRHVVLTHLHTDHAGGLYHFPKSTVWVEKHAYRAATGPFGRLNGYLPQALPSGLEPAFVSFDSPWPLWGGPARPLTRDGAVTLVQTPGHTPHHLSVIVRGAAMSYFLAGDTSYTQAALLAEQVDGVSPRAEVTRRTLRAIRAFAARTPTVYLPSHDPESRSRLERDAYLLESDFTREQVQ